MTTAKLTASSNSAVKSVISADKTCGNCAARCCRFEVFIITDTGVPEEHIHVDDDGTETMLRLDDGWCSALNRNSMMCSIYEVRPWLCREFEMGSSDCIETWKLKGHRKT